jgi:hypothetical protein
MKGTPCPILGAGGCCLRLCVPSHECENLKVFAILNAPPARSHSQPGAPKPLSADSSLASSSRQRPDRPSEDCDPSQSSPRALAHNQIDAVARSSPYLASYCRCVCGFWSTLCFVYFVSASFTTPYRLPANKISTVIIASIWPCVGHAVAIEAMNLAEVLSFLLMPTTAHEVLLSIS